MPEKRIIRPEDLLVLDFQFDNISLLKAYGQPPRLVRTDPRKPCLVTIVFPPQHIQEEVFVNPSHPFTGAPPQASIAGESQIVFQIADADAAAGFPYTLSELLRVCRDASLRVHPNAPPRNLPDPGATLGPPPASLHEILSGPYTAIEAPYRLILSPNRYGAWAHTLLPRTQHREPLGTTADPRRDAAGVTWTEVWHTMLRARPPQGQTEDAFRTVRAIWSPDFPNAAPCDFGALQGVDRQELVKLTGDFADQIGQSGKRADRLSRAIDVEQLALSSLGATMKVLYDQTPPVAGSGGGLSLSTWRHEAIMARDQYVKVAYEGYLYPWGHRVSYVQITQRKLTPEVSGPGTVSFLEKKYYIIVRQPTNSYRRTNPLAMFPEVSIADGQFEIDPPAAVVYQPAQGCTSAVGSEAGEQPFWIMLHGQPYAFDATLTDHNGGLGHFHPGALFVPFGPLQAAAASDVETFLNIAQKAYRTTYLSARYLNFNGQSLAFAPWTTNQNTNLQAFHITFDAQHNIQLTDRVHLFFPTMQSAEAQVPPLNRLRGTDMQCSFQYAAPYLRNGQGFNGDNLGKVYAELTSPVPLDFSGDLSHGKPLFVARISVIALSAKTVIVGGLASGSDADRVASLNTFAAGTFDPQQYFEELQLLQTADLKRLIDPTVSTEPPSITYTNNGSSATATMDWHGTFQVPKADNTKVTGGIHFNASRITTLGAGGGASDALTFTDVSNLLDPSHDFDFTYSNLHYGSGSGQSDFISVGTIDPRIRDGSELQFTGNFFSLLWNHGFQGGATFENGYLVLQAGLRVPDFDLGLFSLHGLAISLVIRLGTLVVNSGFEFKIADPNSPCSLTVAMFYGKGYFVLRCTLLAAVAALAGPIAEVAALGCSFSLDMSFEFGAGVDLHLWKLASLSASISAGIHFELFTDNVIKLVGYFSCHGSLHVLGVGFNVGFDAAFEYVFPASVHVFVNLHVEIDMLFFSIGVDVPVEFSFGGQPLPPNPSLRSLADRPLVAPRLPAAQPPQLAPTFKQQMTRKDWRAYCDAFA